MNNKIVVAGVLGLSIIAFIVGSVFYQDKKQQKQTKTLSEGRAMLVRDHSPTLGSPLYRVTIVEFLDPECESCRMFHPEVKKLLKKYDNQIHYVVRYAPFHRYSKQSVAFLEAARMQDKYWETLDYLFEKQPEWADHHHPKPELKWTYLEKLGLDESKMRHDVNSPHIKKMIEVDIKDGQELNVRGTPTFFINGKMLQRFGAEYLDQAINQALND